MKADKRFDPKKNEQKKQSYLNKLKLRGDSSDRNLEAPSTIFDFKPRKDGAKGGYVNFSRRPSVRTSGVEVNDTNPEKAYDVDLRNLSVADRETAGRAQTDNARKQNRVERFLKAARSGQKFRQKYLIDQPYTTRGGKQLSFAKGDKFGRAGSTAYPEKPELN